MPYPPRGWSCAASSGNLWLEVVMSPPNPDLHHPLVAGVLNAIGWVVASLLTLVAILLGWDRKSLHSKVSALFRWKDNVVDKALKDIPKEYVSQKTCDRNHDTMMKTLNDTHRETLHVRRLLEKHLKINGEGP